MRALLFAVVVFCWAVPMAAQTLITLASTTSTQNSGLYDYLLPRFTEASGIQVNVVAVGTGQAIKIAENGDADALLVHHRSSEDAFVTAGFGIERKDVMYNDYVLVGPKHDPAGLTDKSTLAGAMRALAAQEPLFVSRGDDSGTHKKEREFWANAQVSPGGPWYREIGAGMGAALNMAAAVDAYVLSDRGTWLSFGNKQNLKILYEGEPVMRNPYGIILVNPERHPHVNIAAARRFSEWITSPQGQQVISSFRVDNAQLFCPNAQTPKETEAFCPVKAN